MMSKRTRFKFTAIAFFTVIICAVAKHWLPGIDVTLVGLAMTTILGYLYAETKRPS